MPAFTRGTACPLCEHDNARPSWPMNVFETAMIWIGLRPFDCRECAERFWQVRARVWLFLALGAILIVMLISAITLIIPLGAL